MAGESYGNPKNNDCRTAEKKDSNQKITMMTAYDYPTAGLVDQAGIDTTLVGDSLGRMLTQGHSPVRNIVLS